MNNTDTEQYLLSISTYWSGQNRCEGTVKTVWHYQGRVELELLRTRMDQIPLNTAFLYIYKHRETFRVVKVS